MTDEARGPNSSPKNLENVVESQETAGDSPDSTMEQDVEQYFKSGLDALGKLTLFPAYLAGAWPFTAIAGKEFIPTQWIVKNPGPVLEGPGTRWLVRPLVSRVKGNARDERGKLIRDDDGNIVKRYVTIPSTYQQTDTRGYEFRTDGGALGGTLDVQHTWDIPTKEDAFKFQWHLDRDIGIVEDAVLNKLSYMLEKATWKGEEDPLLEEKEVADLVSRLNKPNIEGHEDPTARSVYDLYGVRSLNVRLSRPVPDKLTKEILSIRKRADAQAYETQQQAKATAKAMKEIYIPQAREALGVDKENSNNRDVAEYARRLAEMDNNEKMVTGGARPVLVTRN